MIYNKFFPIPKFLTMSSVGFDISDHSIKFVELKKTSKGLFLGKFGKQKIPKGVLELGKIKDTKKLIKILNDLRHKYNLNLIRVSLPEEQVYIFNIILPKIKNKEIRNTIELQLEDHIPISANESVFDYNIISEQDDKYNIQVVVLSREVIESYLDIFKQSGLTPVSFELEAQASSRAVIPEGDQGTYMIVDFGDTLTGVSVVSQGIVSFNSTIDIGGSLLTEMVQKGLKIDFDEAEKLKKKYGLKKNLDNKELFPILLSSVSVLRDEINKHYVYWHTHKDENGKDKKKIDKIILCGGNSNLIGLSDYLSTSIRTSVRIADVWININSFSNDIPEITFNDSLGYATAIGLSLGNFFHD